MRWWTRVSHEFDWQFFYVSLQLKSRMQVIQHELQRLSEMLSYNDDDVKRFSHFKSEFSHIFKELRRRKSVKIRRPSIFVQVFCRLTRWFRSTEMFLTFMFLSTRRQGISLRHLRVSEAYRKYFCRSREKCTKRRYELYRKTNRIKKRRQNWNK